MFSIQLTPLPLTVRAITIDGLQGIVACVAIKAFGGQLQRPRQSGRQGHGLGAAAPSTFLAAAGKKDLKEDLLDGYSSEALGREYKIHLDGYDLSDHLKDPDNVPSPRKEIFYFSDDGDLTGLRYDNWKVVFAQQRAPGTMLTWSEPFVNTRVPWLYNLRTDPYERATLTSNTYWDWVLYRAPRIFQGSAAVNRFMATFNEFPSFPRIAITADSVATRGVHEPESLRPTCLRFPDGQLSLHLLGRALGEAQDHGSSPVSRAAAQARSSAANSSRTAGAGRGPS